MRRLASAIGEDYADWPGAADGSDEAAFWQAVHVLAQRWTWFLRLFEDRILTLFGEVKGTKKQLGPRILKSAFERASALRPGPSGDFEPTVFDDLETLWEAGEHVLVAQAVWVLSCLEGAGSRSFVSWLAEPEIEALVGDAVRRSVLEWNPERGDLVERLSHGSVGAHLERLAARAEGECAALRKEIAGSYERLKTYVAEQDEYPGANVMSVLVLDLEMFADELEEIETARDGAIARCRHAALRAQLEGSVDAMRQTRFADERGSRAAGPWCRRNSSPPLPSRCGEGRRGCRPACGFRSRARSRNTRPPARPR